MNWLVRLIITVVLWYLGYWSRPYVDRVEFLARFLNREHRILRPSKNVDTEEPKSPVFRPRHPRAGSTQ